MFVRIELILSGQDLLKNFMRPEVTFQPHGAGQTEAAVEGTTDLSRYAERETVVVGYQYGFDLESIFERQDQFPRVIGGAENRAGCGSSDRSFTRQFRPIRLAQVRHLADRPRPPLIEPSEDLAGAIGRPAVMVDEVSHVWLIQTQKISGNG